MAAFCFRVFGCARFPTVIYLFGEFWRETNFTMRKEKFREQRKTNYVLRTVAAQTPCAYVVINMAMWLIKRLTKRIKQCISEGDVERCRRNAERRCIMVGVVKVCRRDSSQRHRAMFMMQTIHDISPGHNESDGENAESASS